MPDELDYARDFAHAVRFRGEGLRVRPRNVARPDSEVRMSRRLGLEVTAELTPSLNDVVARVAGALHLPRDQVRAFVHSSADVQAVCNVSGGKCIIEVTSALVDHLNQSEQAFVIGHEVGHFLLDHHYLPLPADGSLERHRQIRAHEISADRIGLIACDSAEAAIRATIKTFSGLSENHLRFDAAGFLRQSFQDDAKGHAQSAWQDTHPSFAVRARCLVHFATLLRLERSRSDWQTEFDRVDERIDRDFRTFGEANVERIIQQLEAEYFQWVAVALIVAEGRITGPQLTQIHDAFGAEFAESLRANFSSMSVREVQTFAGEKLASAGASLRRALPTTASSRMQTIAAKAEARFELTGAAQLASRLLT